MELYTGHFINLPDNSKSHEFPYLRTVKIFLTFDYELFFGDNAGSATKCMLEPTADLLEIAKEKNIHYTFFIDVGYLIQAEKYPEISEEFSLVKQQIAEMLALRHDVQLHIHPHWEKAVFENGQ